MKKVLLLIAITVTGFAQAQNAPQIGVGMDYVNVERAIDHMKSEIGVYDAWKVDFEVKKWDNLITVTMDPDGADFLLEVRFNENREVQIMSLSLYFPVPKGMSPNEMIKAIGGVADPETLAKYGQPSSSTLKHAVWNRTKNEVTGNYMKMTMGLEPVGLKSVKLFAVQTLVR